MQRACARIAAKRLMLVGAARPRAGSVIAASGHSSRRGSLGGGPDSAASRARRFLVEAGAPFVLLADVRLDDADVADGQRVGRDRRRGQEPQERGRADDDDERKPLAVIFEPDRAAEQDDEPGQAVSADQRA